MNRCVLTVIGFVVAATMLPAGSAAADEATEVFKNRLYFSASTSKAGCELWSTNGTKKGTKLVANLDKSYDDSNPVNFHAGKKYLFFQAWKAGMGRELWRTDGTKKGTKFVKDINPGSADSNPGHFATYKGITYFRAETANEGQELWRTDGTTAGTYMVTDFWPGTASSAPEELTVFGGALYFEASTTGAYMHFWRFTGEEDTIEMVDPVSGSSGYGYGSGPFVVFKNQFYMGGALDPTVMSLGSELIKVDPITGAGTLIKDINTGPYNSSPAQLMVAGGVLYFNAYTTAAGNELWRSDGTAAGTKMIKDIWSGEDPGVSSSVSEARAVLGKKLVFAAHTPSTGDELWITNGTTKGTKLIKDIWPGSGGSQPWGMASFKKKVFFVASTYKYGDELWVTNGTKKGTTMVKNIGGGDSAHCGASYF